MGYEYHIWTEDVGVEGGAVIESSLSGAKVQVSAALLTLLSAGHIPLYAAIRDTTTKKILWTQGSSGAAIDGGNAVPADWKRDTLALALHYAPWFLAFGAVITGGIFFFATRGEDEGY